MSFLLSRSFTATEIAQQLGVDRSTISRDIKVLKADAQQFVYDLAKSNDLAYYFKKSLDGIEETKKEAWRIFYNQTVSVRDKLLALRLIVMSERSGFELLMNGPGVLAMKNMEDRLSRVEMGNSSRQQIDR